MKSVFGSALYLAELLCASSSVCLEKEEAWSGRLLFGVWESCGACLALLHSCLVADKASGVNWLYGQIGCFCYWLATQCYVGCMGPIRWRHTPVCDRPRTYMHWTAVSGFKAARVAQQGQPSTRCISYFRLSAGCRQFRSWPQENIVLIRHLDKLLHDTYV